MWYIDHTGNREAKGGCTSFYSEGTNSPPENKRKEGDAMITYTEFYQFCILIVSLVNLFYQIYKDKRK